MKENDVIIITLKGENTKKYFLNKIAPNFGVRFKKIPKESLVIEVKVNSKKSLKIIKDLLEMNFFKESDFQVEENPKHEEGEYVECKKSQNNNKEMNDTQREILDYMKKHKGQYFAIRELAYYTKHTETKVKTILESLREMNLIKAIKFRNGRTYFYISKN